MGWGTIDTATSTRARIAAARAALATVPPTPAQAPPTTHLHALQGRDRALAPTRATHAHVVPTHTIPEPGTVVLVRWTDRNAAKSTALARMLPPAARRHDAQLAPVPRDTDPGAWEIIGVVAGWVRVE